MSTTIASVFKQRRPALRYNSLQLSYNNLHKWVVTLHTVYTIDQQHKTSNLLKATRQLRQVMQKMEVTNFRNFCWKNSGISGLEKNGSLFVPLKWVADTSKQIDIPTLMKSKQPVLFYWPPMKAPLNVSRAKDRSISAEVGWPTYMARILGTASK